MVGGPEVGRHEREEKREKGEDRREERKKRRERKEKREKITSGGRLPEVGGRMWVTGVEDGSSASVTVGRKIADDGEDLG